MTFKKSSLLLAASLMITTHSAVAELEDDDVSVVETAKSKFQQAFDFVFIDFLKLLPQKQKSLDVTMQDEIARSVRATLSNPYGVVEDEAQGKTPLSLTGRSFVEGDLPHNNEHARKIVSLFRVRDSYDSDQVLVNNLLSNTYLVVSLKANLDGGEVKGVNAQRGYDVLDVALQGVAEEERNKNLSLIHRFHPKDNKTPTFMEIYTQRLNQSYPFDLYPF